MSLAIFRLETFVCDPSLGNFHLETLLGNFRLRSFALKHLLGNFILDLSFGNFRLRAFGWNFRLDIPPGNFRLRSLALKHSRGNVRFVSFVRELPLGISRLIYCVWDASLGTFRLGFSLGIFVWELRFVILRLGIFAWIFRLGTFV